MEIRAVIRNADADHHATVSTDGRATVVAVPGRPGGGSALNGGELLCLALATCYCNDLYREARQRGITLTSVVVEATAEFGGPGEPARRITYAAQVTAADATPADIEALLAHTDSVAEVHNTLRAGIVVERRSVIAP